MKLIRRILSAIKALFTTKPSAETIRRVKRTFWQTLQANVVVGVVAAKVAENAQALLLSVVALIGTVLASYATNVLEDADQKKDRR